MDWIRFNIQGFPDIRPIANSLFNNYDLTLFLLLDSTESKKLYFLIQKNLLNSAANVLVLTTVAAVLFFVWRNEGIRDEIMMVSPARRLT